MGDAKLLRYRISIPKEDRSIFQWINAQANLSHSIRTIIRADIEENGINDATCRPVNKRSNLEPKKVKKATTVNRKRQAIKEQEPETKEQLQDFRSQRENNEDNCMNKTDINNILDI